ncbi:MAG: hypothetical protein NHB15_11805 [Methanosarcina barkeri]|nr:hypothetical protein [Methanosarcina sp. ERenArc_MAG2]
MEKDGLNNPEKFHNAIKMSKYGSALTGQSSGYVSSMFQIWDIERFLG